ncbi:hypothetical protein SAMN05421844_10851 [Bosea robiniae]|uniref:Lectin-like protein BA14k n=1 Tax=Bosea robiniae TaxID=1036780 RepID=A0ABY0P4U0_9HYPH|nr:hypothetical protein SAMN05421844_10851 [Bosea robiniae]
MSFLSANAARSLRAASIVGLVSKAMAVTLLPISLVSFDAQAFTPIGSRLGNVAPEFVEPTQYRRGFAERGVAVGPRGGVVARRGYVARGPRGAVAGRGYVARGPRGNVVAGRGAVVRPGYRPVPAPVRPWVRPAGYWWHPGLAVVSGAAIGFATAAAARAYVSSQPPAPGYCWFYTNPQRTQGFWDVCPP